MGVKNPNQRRKVFINEYLKSGNAEQAAIKAGYSAKTAYSQGSRLLKDEQIAAEIAKKQGKAAAKANITVETIIAELEEARQLAKDNIKPAAMVSATVNKAKVAGVYNEVVEHKGDVTVILQRFKRDETGDKSDNSTA